MRQRTRRTSSSQNKSIVGVSKTYIPDCEPNQSEHSPPAKKVKPSPRIASIFASPSKPKVKSNGHDEASITGGTSMKVSPSKPAWMSEASTSLDQKAESSSKGSAETGKESKEPKAGPSKPRAEGKSVASIFAKPVKKEKVEEQGERESAMKEDEGEEELDDESEDEEEEEAAVKLYV